MAAAQVRDGGKVRPHFTIVILAFGFLVLYNVLSLPPTVDLIDKLQLSGLKLGDVRLDLAVPAAAIAILLWSWLASIKVKDND
jgi:hypothetical protein